MKEENAAWLSIEPIKALQLVAGYSGPERRTFRRRLGRVGKLSDLDDASANFFYGECLVFNMVSEDIRDWMAEHFFGKRGSPANYLRMRDLFRFYQALISDVDIRYSLIPSEDGGFKVEEHAIMGNTL